MCVAIYAIVFFGYVLGMQGKGMYTQQFKDAIVLTNLTRYVTDISNVAILHHPGKLFDIADYSDVDMVLDASPYGVFDTERMDYTFQAATTSLLQHPRFASKYMPTDGPNLGGYYDTDPVHLSQLEALALFATGVNSTDLIPAPRWYVTFRSCVDYHDGNGLGGCDGGTYPLH